MYTKHTSKERPFSENDMKQVTGTWQQSYEQEVKKQNFTIFIIKHTN